MVDNTEAIPIDILSEVIRCCTVIGQERTLHGIRMLSLDDEGQSTLSNTIIDVICREMPITRQALLSGNARGESDQARMYLYVLHNMYMGCDAVELSRMFSKQYQLIWKKLKNFKSLNADHRFDMMVLQKFNSIKEVVETELSNL